MRLLLFVLMAAAFVYFWQAFNQTPLRVIGQLTSTGLLQRDSIGCSVWAQRLWHFVEPVQCPVVAQ